MIHNGSIINPHALAAWNLYRLHKTSYTMWKKISSKTVFDHPRIKLQEDTVELPNGHQTEYVLLDEKGGDAAGILVINDEGKILLIHEYVYPINQVMIEIPGGGIPEGEDPSAGAMRELQEETGFSAHTFIKLGEYFPQERRSSRKMSVFLAKDLEVNPLPQDDEENIEVHWYSEKQVEDMIRTGVITNVHTLAAWTLYKLYKS